MRGNKYRAVKTEVDGITFDSKKEAKRYGELKLLQKKGVIRFLETQPRFDFEINGVRLGFYKADFKYEESLPVDIVEKPSHVREIEVWQSVVEDCKGFKTPVYNLKKKLMKALHGIDILET